MNHCNKIMSSFIYYEVCVIQVLTPYNASLIPPSKVLYKTIYIASAISNRITTVYTQKLLLSIKFLLETFS